MANQFTETSSTGFGSRIINSIIGIPIGFALVVGAIGFLYWNEGRFDTSKLAKTAVEVSATQAAPSDSEGKLVAVNGSVHSSEDLGDEYLKADKYLALSRKSEMFAWVENVETKSDNHTGGSETTTKTYTYKTEWTDNVADSTTFNHPEDHTNPAKTIPSQTLTVREASVGNYNLLFAGLKLPTLANLPLTSANSTGAAGFTITPDGKYFKGASYDTPQVGDVRLGYSVLPNDTPGTVFGKLTGHNLSLFTDDKGHQLYRFFLGDKAASIKTLHQEYRTTLWLIRGGGFLAIFIGLSMLMRPLTTILSFFPTLGRIGGAVVGVIVFPVALLLAGVTVIVGMVAHNPIALAIALVGALGVSAWFIKRKGQKLATS